MKKINIIEQIKAKIKKILTIQLTVITRNFQNYYKYIMKDHITKIKKTQLRGMKANIHC